MLPRPWLAVGRKRQLARPGTGVSLCSVADELLAAAICSKAQVWQARSRTKRKGSWQNWGGNLFIGVKNLSFLYPSPHVSDYSNYRHDSCSVDQESLEQESDLATARFALIKHSLSPSTACPRRTRQGRPTMAPRTWMRFWQNLMLRRPSCAPKRSGI